MGGGEGVESCKRLIVANRLVELPRGRCSDIYRATSLVLLVPLCPFSSPFSFPIHWPRSTAPFSFICVIARAASLARSLSPIFFHRSVSFVSFRARSDSKIGSIERNGDLPDDELVWLSFSDLSSLAKFYVGSSAAHLSSRASSTGRISRKCAFDTEQPSFMGT